jgi:hypothetical protein
VILAKLPPRAGDAEDKLMVVLGHRAKTAVTIKATTKLALYQNNEELRAGVVLYRAGETCFHEDTAIQANNWFPVPHRDLRDPRCIVGHLPADFHGRLVAAIAKSVELTQKNREALLAMIGDGAR